MNEHIKQLIDALRSNKYKQTRGQLRVNDCFCVIGVAANVADPSRWEADHFWGCPNDYSYMGLIGSIPENVPEYYGFSQHFLVSLMRLNDAFGYPFPQLADVIEKAVADGTAFNEGFEI